MIMGNDVGALSLALSLMVWIAIAMWLNRAGWRVQRRYFTTINMRPINRMTVVWVCALTGMVTLLAAHASPMAPAIVTLAMIGPLSAFVDAKTHKLPTRYTLILAGGAIIGIASVIFCSEYAQQVNDTWWISMIGGMVMWTLPLWLSAKISHGAGYGDVKLAPVLGALTGISGWACTLGGLVICFVGAGIAAVWAIIALGAHGRTRVALGPWLIGGAALALVLWEIIPSWQIPA